MKKNNKIKSFLVAAALMAFSGTAFAQLESSVYFNMLFPTGTFAKDVDAIPLTRENIGKDAVFGIGGTYRMGYVFDIQVGLIEPYAELGFNWNRISSDRRDDYEKLDFHAPNYFNIPLMLGINYKYPLTEIVQPYAEFGFGVDYFKATREGKKDNTTMDYRYKANTALCWQIGAGAIIGKYFSAGINYVSYGRHKMEYRSSSMGTNSGGQEHRTIGTIALKLGFHF